MSILSSIFFRKHTPKVDYVLSVIVLESVFGIAVFEKGARGLVLVDSRFKNLDKGDFDRIAVIAEDIISPIEKSLDTEFSDTLFVIPSFATNDTDGKVIQPFRNTIRGLITEFEFNALGYVDLFEVIRTTAKNDEHWLFLERGEQSANIILCGLEDIKKKLRVTSDADEICAHIEESATKKAKIYYFSPHVHEDDLTFKRNLSGYNFVELANEDIVKNINVILADQIFGSQVKISPDVQNAEAVTGEVTPEQIELSLDSNTSTSENMIIEHNSESIDTSQEVLSANIDATRVKASSDNIGSGHDLKGPEPAQQPSENEDFADFVVYNSDEHLETPVNIPQVHQRHNSSSNQVNSPKETQPDNIEYVHHEEKSVSISKVVDASAVVNDTSDTSESNRMTLGIFDVIRSWILPALVAIVLAILLGVFVFYHKAEVTLVVKTEPFTADIKLNNFDLKILKSKKALSTSVESTGTKDIGERAKGSVVMASFDDKIASFSAGTTLFSGNKVFRLDADVALDPATVDTTQGTKIASRKSVKASATFIGSGGNIDKGVDLMVGEYPKSIYYATADSAFSGGSSQTVSAISQADVDAIDEKLLSLAEQATSEAIMESLKEDVIVIKELSESSLDDVEYSAALGDAKSDLSASANANYSIYYGQDSELVKAVSSAVSSKVGNKYKFDIKDIKFETKTAVLNSNGKSANLELQVFVDVYIPPALEPIKKTLLFLPANQVDGRIVGTNNLADARVKIVPDLPPFKWLLPFVMSNINLQVISDTSR